MKVKSFGAVALFGLAVLASNPGFAADRDVKTAGANTTVDANRGGKSIPQGDAAKSAPATTKPFEVTPYH
jgi:hypothetical protein